VIHSFAPPKEKPRTADDVTCDDISTYATSLESILQGTNQNTEKMLAQSKGTHFNVSPRHQSHCIDMVFCFQFWQTHGLSSVSHSICWAFSNLSKRSEFPVCLLLTSNSQLILECLLQEMALGNAFQKLGHCADRLSVLYNQKASKESLQFHEPVQDYLRLVDSIKVRTISLVSY
jgi:hypothetical protein